MSNRESRPLLLFLTNIYLIAILPKEIQMLFILFLLVVLVIKKKKIYIDKKMIPFFLIFFVHIIAIIFYVIINNDTSRIVAAINTASLWLIGGLIFSFIPNFNISKEELEKISFINISILICMAFIMMMLSFTHYSNISILSRSLIGEDWLNGIKDSRLLGFLEYSNLIVLMFFLLHPFAINYVKKKKSKVFQIVFLIMSIFPILLTNSRIGTILLALYLCFAVPQVISINKKSLMMISILMILFGSVYIIINNKTIIEKTNSIIHSRENSTITRNVIYSESIKKAMDKSPIIGLGVKEYLGNYPLGSHSTIVGLLYKTGIVGLILGLFGFSIIIIEYLKRKNWLITFSFLCLLASLIFEDLDGANWFVVLFFSITSIYISKYEVKKNV